MHDSARKFEYFRHGSSIWTEWASFSPPIFRLAINYCPSAVFLLLGSILGASDPLILKWLVDTVLPSHRLDLLVGAGLGFLGIHEARLFCQAWGSLKLSQAVNWNVLKSRQVVFSHLQQLSASFYRFHRTGDVASRIDHELQDIGEIVGELLPVLLRVVSVLVFIVIVLAFLDKTLTMILVLLLPVSALIQIRCNNKMGTNANLAQQRSGELASFLNDAIGGITQVQLLSSERRQVRECVRLSIASFRAQLRLRKGEWIFSIGTLSSVVAAMSLVLIYGGWRVMIHRLTVGGLVAFFGYVSRLFEPLGGFTDIVVKLQRARSSVGRIFELISSASDVIDSRHAILLPIRHARKIALEEITFRYEPETPLIDKISCILHEGEKVALSGRSGSGKSTLMGLLARLYDVQEGSIQLDGTDIRSIRLDNLRQQVSLVPQFPLLFRGTLYENLTLGVKSCSQASLDRVLEIVHLESFLGKRPEGLRMVVEYSGSNLSGGERQRIALARALLQARPILLLDEATSALDTEAEKDIFTALQKENLETTMILVSHRENTLSLAERRIILDGGRLYENTSDFLGNADTRAVAHETKVGVLPVSLRL